MNIVKKHNELRANQQRENNIEEAPISRVDAQTAYSILRNTISNSRFIRECKDIKILPNEEPTLIPVVNNPLFFEDFVVVTPKRHFIQVDCEDSSRLQELSQSIGRQIASYIDNYMETNRYSSATVVIVNEIEISNTIDLVVNEKIIQVFFKFDVA